jgi:predicted PurR-regulated permease PerM
MVTIILYIVPELILRPYLIGKVSSIHPLLILLSFMGGGIVGGIAGFFLAPVAVGMIIAAYNVYAKADLKSDRISQLLFRMKYSFSYLFKHENRKTDCKHVCEV